MQMLYICYHRLCEPLGEATVIPYLKILSSLGVDLDVISFEDKKYLHHLDDRKKFLSSYKINLYPLRYRNNIRFISGVINLANGIYAAFKILKKNKFQVVYAKGTVAGIIASVLKWRFSNLKIIFDNDGLWAQERKDARIWGNFIFFYTLAFFLEKYIYKQTDYLVVLTSGAAEYVKDVLKYNKPVFIRPICADNSFFEKQNDEILKKHSLLKGKISLIYAGAVGTWYMLNEMIDFFKVMQEKEPNSFFIFLTYPDNIENVKQVFLDKGIDQSSFMVDFCNHSDIKKYYAVASAGIYFIKPFVSKKASSPTKLAEMLASNLFVVTNKGIGDVDVLLQQNEAGVICESFENVNYCKNVDILLDKIKDPNVSVKCKETATKFLSMETAQKVYKALLDQIIDDMRNGE